MDAPSVEYNFSADQLMALAVICLAAILAIFIILALVRMWGLRMQQQRGGCGGLDVEALRRQRDSGEITQEEFDRILGGITGGRTAAAMRPAKVVAVENPPQPPIKNMGEPGSDPDRSVSDG